MEKPQQCHAVSRQPLRRVIVLFTFLCCLSCSRNSGLNSVHGKVLYQDQPIEGVVVTFHPKHSDVHTTPTVGRTGEDGSFTMFTGKNEGAPPGEYVVTFICPEQTEEKTKGKPKKTVMQRLNLEDRFKGAYGNEAKSAFKVEIKPGKNELDPFRLK